MLRVGEETLRAANNMGPDDEPTYQQCIVLPASLSGDGQGGGGGAPEGEFYVVTFGDTLDQIAFMHNVSLQSLRIVNGIADNKSLLAGTTLFIPADAPAYGEYPAIFRLDQFGAVAGEEYVMQPGDTLDSVAQEHDISVISIMMANNIENNRFIQAGTVIILPEGAARYGEFPPIMRADDGTETLGQGGGGPNEYVVQPGDYPQKIAREMNVDLLTFMDANGIENSYTLMPGTVLIVPADAPPFSEDGIPPVSVRPVTSNTTTNMTQTNQAQPTPTIESAGSDTITVPVQPTATTPAPNNEIPSPVTTENP
jgi:LysM repeat protein